MHGHGQEIDLSGGGWTKAEMPACIGIEGDDTGPGFEIGHRTGAAEIRADPGRKDIARRSPASWTGKRQDGPVKQVRPDEDEDVIDRIGQGDGPGPLSRRVAQVKRNPRRQVLELVADERAPVRRRLFEHGTADRVVEKPRPVEAVIECDGKAHVALSFSAIGSLASPCRSPGTRSR